jgi:hypothetical protein
VPSGDDALQTHLDKDFDLIAEITGQPMERLNVLQTADLGNDADQTEP